jgi:hypothetical protein
MNRKQWETLGIGIPGIIAMSLFSRFYIDTFNSLDKINQIYLSELFAACITIVIFIIRKKFNKKF